MTDEISEFREKYVTEKPCHILGYCVYGPLVENFPLLEEPDEWTCDVFGHQCPVHYVAEPFVDGDEE